MTLRPRHLLLAAAAAAALTLASPASAGLVQIDPNHNGVTVQNAVGTSASGSGTVTAGGTYQTVFAANANRKGCSIQNPTTATEVLNVRTAGAIVWTVPVGATFTCGSPGVVISDLVEVTATTTSHAFTAAQQ